MPQTTLPEIIAKVIRDKVKSGKTKIDVANELGVSYYMVKKHTRDISTILRIPVEIEQQIREEVRKVKSVREVAKELNVSRDTVIKYTRDIPKKLNIEGKQSPELIKQIRANVMKYNSKIKTARKMGLTYGIVRWYARDIPIKRGLPKEMKEKIRIHVKNGKSKTQVARELNISLNIVSKYTRDIYEVQKKADISYRAFLLLQELMNKGYAFPCSRYGLKEYQILKNKFPKIYRVRMYRKTIFFFEDKADVAIRAYLKSLDIKITNYQELKQVIKAFKTNISSEEKKKYIHKKKTKERNKVENLLAAPSKKITIPS